MFVKVINNICNYTFTFYYSSRIYIFKYKLNYSLNLKKLNYSLTVLRLRAYYTSVFDFLDLPNIKK